MVQVHFMIVPYRFLSIYHFFYPFICSYLFFIPNHTLFYILHLFIPVTARLVMSFFSAKLDCPIVILSSAALLFL